MKCKYMIIIRWHPLVLRATPPVERERGSGDFAYNDVCGWSAMIALLRNNKPLNLQARIATPHFFQLSHVYALRCVQKTATIEHDERLHCGIDVEADKKNRRSLSSSDVCRTIVTDIALSCSQGTSRSHLNV